MATTCRRAAAGGLLLLAAAAALAAEPAFVFGVVSQRNSTATAEFWTPILRYVAEKSGVPLRLRLGGSGAETAEMVHRQELDFAYTNHHFAPGNARAGYHVIARPVRPAIRGLIVVRDDAPFTSLAQLEGRDVAFPHRHAFVGYCVPMDALLRADLHVKPTLAGNQEEAMALLKSGRVQAAAVNSKVLRDFCEQEGLRTRTLWMSEPFLGIPVVAHARVPADKARAVEKALVEMDDDPAGRRILEAAAATIGQKPPHGFVRARDGEYGNVRRAYRESLACRDL